MFRRIGLLALMALATLGLGFVMFVGAAMIRDGPTAATQSGDVNSTVGTTVGLPSAILNVTTLAGDETINLVSTTTATGMEDGFGTSLATMATLPLIFYIAAMITIVGAMAFLTLRHDELVDKRVRTIGGAIGASLKPAARTTSRLSIVA